MTGSRRALAVLTLVVVAVALTGCATQQHREELAARADATAAVWASPDVQQRWAEAVVARPPLGQFSDAGPVSVKNRLELGLVELAPGVGGEGGRATVDHLDGPDQDVPLLGARAALAAVETSPVLPCESYGACEPLRVLRAEPTTMPAPTARGAAVVPAWSFVVDGVEAPVVLPAVALTSPADIVAGQDFSDTELVGRDGRDLTVEFTAPFCGNGYGGHVLETDAAVVVWATGVPLEMECAAPSRKVETFTLRAPVGDRPVVGEDGRVVVPDVRWPVSPPPGDRVG